MTTELKRAEPKARVIHTCSWCSGIIFIGQTFERSTLIDDGKLYYWKSHLYCRELTNKLNMWEDCYYGEGLDSSTFSEYIWEEHRSKELRKWEEQTFLEVLDKVLQHHKLSK